MKPCVQNTDRIPIRAELDNARYPERVKMVMRNRAPKHLDMIGNLDLLDMPGIGFCGSRKSSNKGLEIAKDCAEQATHSGVSVVSGNAAGIDFVAHFSSLKAGGKTILVLPEGINHFRIKTSLKPVWDWERVLVISQFEPDDPWKSFRAMTRNQLTIALSRAMIVIEAGEKGGTITAGKQALKLGLPLFVAQHQDIEADTYGNRMLIDMGAQKFVKNNSNDCPCLAKILQEIREDKLQPSIPQQGRFL